MKKRGFPTAQTILILIAVLVMVLTWIVPAGEYDSLSYESESNTFIVTGSADQQGLPATQNTLDELNIKIPVDKFTSGDIYKPVGIPGTYHELEPQPQGLAALAKSPVRGIIEAADIIFLILIIGGLIGIMNATGAFDAGIAWMSKTLTGREYLLIVAVTTLIALGGTTFGLAEETMAFFPILIPVFIAAGYDAIVGLACIFLGSAIGTMCSTINPFSTIIASDSAGISWTTGFAERVIILILCLVITLWYILRYAKKVKAEPSHSLVYEQAKDIKEQMGVQEVQPEKSFDARLLWITIVFSLCFVVMIAGVSFLGWWFIEMTTVFLVGAILIGMIARMKEKAFVKEFMKGAADLLSVAFIVGIARGVTIIMEDGLISDTILFHASQLTTGMNAGLFTNLMLLIFAGLSFFIPSSSGMAVLTMPIMAPLADSVGIGRDIIVNCYQYGAGLFYIINPTGLILAALAIVNIGFDKWLKFVWPLMLWLTGATVVFMTFSVYFW